MYGRGQQTMQFGPPRTPDVIKTLMLVNVGVFILQFLLGGAIVRSLAITPQDFWWGGATEQIGTGVESGFGIPHLWQAFTYMWLHGDMWHLLFNMFALWMFGSPVASFWGEGRFVRFYLICGVGAGVIIAAWPALLMLLGMPTPQYFMPTLGASGQVSE